MLIGNDTADSVDFDSVLSRNHTLLFDIADDNSSLFFPRTLYDSIGPMQDDFALPNATRVRIPTGYLIGLSIGACALLFSIAGIALLQRRKAKVVLLPDHSIFASQNENKAWDSLSFSYGGADSDVGKNSWESDDSYLASLDEVIAQRASVVAFQKRATAVVVPHPIGEATAVTANSISIAA
uniref:FHA domain-containing protein n=1 Tax=Plectus sambesii TaxID=2011161 RepID=A0A914WRJ8_9BILA